MKLSKKFFAIAGVFLVIVSVVIISCRKDGQSGDTEKAPIVTKGKQMKLTWDFSSTSGRMAAPPPCDTHGGSIGFDLEWDLATCRSLCTRGLGLRCGRKTRVYCADGASFDNINYGSCPNGASVYNYSRFMAANTTFYKDGNVKLTFLNAVPADDVGNTDFEIEVDELIAIPDGVLLDGTAYKGFQPKVGIYKVDYSDGHYGSVTLPSTLIPK